MKILRIFVIIIISGPVLVGFWFLKNEYRNRTAIAEIRPVSAWIENFYTLNARFPANEEFYRQFPNLRFIKEYVTLDVYDQPGSAQDFNLTYFISRPTRSDALGKPKYADWTGYTGTYLIKPCPRWRALGLDDPWPFMNVWPPGGLVESNFKTGEISFKKESNFKTGEISFKNMILLSGLRKPRLFQKLSNGRTTHVIVTDGTDVISYEWSEFGPALLNPKRVGDVPVSCPADSS